MWVLLTRGNLKLEDKPSWRALASVPNAQSRLGWQSWLEKPGLQLFPAEDNI